MRALGLTSLLLVACSPGNLKIDDDTDGTSPDGTDTVDSLGESDATATESSTDVSSETDGVADSDLAGETDPTADTDRPLCMFDDGVLPNLRPTGPQAFSTSTGSTAVSSCSMSWKRFTPNTTVAHTAVVLSHGFVRSRDNVAGWAEHLASWGFEVITPSLCHSSIEDTQHVTNGHDLADLADDLLAGRPVVYIGHSAGGLASVVAADIDTDVVGVFGLDLVDTDNIGKDAAGRVTAPVWGVKGNNSLCNSQGNGTAVYNNAANGRFHRITDATHCDFENPTNWVCEAPCLLLNPAFDDGAQRNATQAMMTSFTLMASGEDLDGEQYWTPGCDRHDLLVNGGILR